MKLDFSRDIYLYSQTTKSLDEFHRIIDYIQSHIAEGATFKSFDTICRSVANRMPNISNFATKHDLILFVCGRKSSNGKVLFNECLRVNPNSQPPHRRPLRDTSRVVGGHPDRRHLRCHQHPPLADGAMPRRHPQNDITANHKLGASRLARP